MREMRATLQNQQTKMNAMQLTIAQQRNTIAQLKSGKTPSSTITTTAMAKQQRRKDAAGTPKRTPTEGAAPTTAPKAFQFTAAISPPKSREEKVAAEKKAEDHVNEDEEVLSASDSEDEDGDDENATAGTSTSSAAMAKATETAAAKQPLGYAGLNNRIRQLTNITNYWGKNLENLEQRLLNKITQVMQQQQQQLQQQQQQFQQQLQQQIEQQLNPEKLQTLVDAAVQRYCNAATSPPSSP